MTNGESPQPSIFRGIKYENKSWMALLEDNLKISSLSIPGTHDSAAINTVLGGPYSCHSDTLTQQMVAGIRLLDIRLQVSIESTDPGYGTHKFKFMTCHSDVDLGLSANVYQTFESALEECRDFLNAQPSEFIAMLIKIDQWKDVDVSYRAEAIEDIGKLIATYKPIWQGSKLATLGDVRNKFYVMNRTGYPSERFSTPPISWPNNCKRAEVPATAEGQYNLLVQDKWENTDENEKFELWSQLVVEPPDYQTTIALNFASGTAPSALLGSVVPRGVYIMKDVIIWLGGSVPRRRNLGWTLFDYENQSYDATDYDFDFRISVTDLWMDANYDWSNYPLPFRIIGNM